MEDDGGFHFLGEDLWSYNHYQPGGEFKRHRTLAKNKNQVDETCACHASVKVQESDLRLQRASLVPGLITPRLSIQHHIDLVNEKDVLGNVRLNLDILKEEGVQSYLMYDGSLNNTDRGWSYRIKDYEIYSDEQYRWYDIRFMDMLFDWLHTHSSFIGCFWEREGHSKKRLKLKMDPKCGMEPENRFTIYDGEVQRSMFKGKMGDDGHAVVITGYNRKVENGVLGGFWVFQDHNGNENFGCMDFNVLDEICLVDSFPCGSIVYKD